MQRNYSKITDKKRLSTLPISIQYMFEILARAVRELKEIKGLQNGKEEIKGEDFCLVLYSALSWCVVVVS